jgi:hypothetical protein
MEAACTYVLPLQKIPFYCFLFSDAKSFFRQQHRGNLNFSGSDPVFVVLSVTCYILHWLDRTNKQYFTNNLTPNLKGMSVRIDGDLLASKETNPTNLCVT